MQNISKAQVVKQSFIFSKLNDKELAELAQLAVERMTANAQQSCSLYIEDVEKDLKYKGFKVKTESSSGKPAEEIVKSANNNKVDLIVMASHGRSGVSRWAYGSVAEKVLRSSCVPVLLVKVPGCVVDF